MGIFLFSFRFQFYFSVVKHHSTDILFVSFMLCSVILSLYKLETSVIATPLGIAMQSFSGSAILFPFADAFHTIISLNRRL